MMGKLRRRNPEHTARIIEKIRQELNGISHVQVEFSCRREEEQIYEFKKPGVYHPTLCTIISRMLPDYEDKGLEEAARRIKEDIRKWEFRVPGYSTDTLCMVVSRANRMSYEDFYELVKFAQDPEIKRLRGVLHRFEFLLSYPAIDETEKYARIWLRNGRSYYEDSLVDLTDCDLHDLHGRDIREEVGLRIKAPIVYTMYLIKAVGKEPVVHNGRGRIVNLRRGELLRGLDVEYDSFQEYPAQLDSLIPGEYAMQITSALPSSLNEGE